VDLCLCVEIDRDLDGYVALTNDGTAIIDICHLASNFKARALIDSGSEATFISERLFKLIKLPHQVIRTQVSGFNQTLSAESKKLCQ